MLAILFKYGNINNIQGTTNKRNYMNNSFQTLTITYNGKSLRTKIVRAWDKKGESLLYKGKIVEEVLILLTDEVATIPMLKKGLYATYSDKTKSETYEVKLTLTGVEATQI